MRLVSIHAPARGATAAFLHGWKHAKVSIHAPARGATEGGSVTRHLFCCFNPRSRTGSDARSSHTRLPRCVSIHAPARGATIIWRNTPVRCASFQSTLPHGERPTNVIDAMDKVLFQSTLPHGERPRAGLACASTGTFQSTLPHGERQRMITLDNHSPGCFNPRSRTGSDKARLTGLLKRYPFQSTLPHGERPS